MNDFPPVLKSQSLESAKAEVFKYYKEFCSCNPITADIEEATSIEELKGICRFMNSLCFLLSRVDPTGIQRDYSSDLRVFANKLDDKE